MPLLRFFWALVFLLVALPAYAVDLTGQIRGTVEDESGLPVPSVVINVRAPEMQGARSADSGPQGEFHFLGLPPGNYTIEALKAGFNTSKSEARVGAGSTVTLKITLSLANSGEEITVEASKPVVDVTRTQTGVTLSKEMLKDIPNSGRDYQSAISLSPGVVGSGNANMHGGYYTGNQYYLDGVNTTDPLTGTFSMNMNFDAIEEIQVITGGMDPEYGRAMGGAVNVETQSGGNDFEGSVQLIYSGSNTELYKPLPDEDPSGQTELNESLQTYVGGPIIKDKLWFAASLQGDNFITTESVPSDVHRPADDPIQPRYWRSIYLFGKVTWQPSVTNRLWVQAQGDPTDIRNSEQSAYTLSSGESWFRQGGWLASVGHIFMPGSNTKIETQIYTSDSYIKVAPIQWLDCKEWGEAGEVRQVPVCVDDGWTDGAWYASDPDGFSYGPQATSYYTDRKRSSLNSSWTQLFQLLGEHQTKVGIQAELMSSYTIAPGSDVGYNYYTYTGDDPSDLTAYVPDIQYRYDTDQEALFKGVLLSWYAQDVWHPISRLTVRGGVRFDQSNLMDDTNTSVFKKLTVAPRVGVAYDLTGDAKTSVHAYYGRFYDSGYLEVSDLLSKKVGGYAAYNWDDRTQDWSETPSFAVSPTFLVHDDLRNPYADKFNFGVNRNLGDGWGMDTTFVYEASHNYWEDDETNLIWNDDGTDVIGYRNGEASDLYRLRTPDEIFSQYTSLEVAFSRQFDDHWGMLASYTWSQTYGVDKGNDTGLATTTLDNPEQDATSIGVLSYDRPHAIKVAGSYQEPNVIAVGDNASIGLLSGWDFRMYAGEPLRRVSYNAYYQGWNNYYGGDEDGRYRLPAYSELDLKLGLSADIGPTHWELTAECFNVLNTRTVTSYDTTYTDENGDIYTSADGQTLWMTPTSRQDPRYFQFGLRSEF